VAGMTRQRLAVRRWTSIGVGVAVLGAVLWGAPAQAQSASRSALESISGTCGEASVRLTGDLSLSLPAGSTVTNRYSVTSTDQHLDLGSADTTATATVATTIPFADDVFFGPRWVPAFPFTYTMATDVRVDTAVVSTQVLTAVCTAAGEPSSVTIIDGPVPGAPNPDAIPLLVPSFTG